MIELESANMRALVSPFGAALVGLWVKGHAPSLVIGTSDETALRRHLPYFGSLVGPIANRVGGARVTIEGESWTLPCNDGQACLHGGPRGLHAIRWTVRHRDSASVTLQCRLAHGVGGLPGNREIEARYRVTDPACLALSITARSDRMTPMNIAHHPYWTLDGQPTIAHHRLQVMAERYLPTREDKVPTGKIALVAGTPFDFRSLADVPLSPALDVNFCVSDQRHAQPRRCAVLEAPGGPGLEIRSTEPGLQVYGGAGLGPVPVRLHDDRVLAPHAGVALEPQGWPDAPNHPHFPSILIGAGETYRQVTEYHVESRSSQNLSSP